jgi:hypothetical protein
VTAANRFATTAAPDGRTLLVLAGAAAQARLVGDPRARFNAAGWLPVCAAQVPALLVGRGEMPSLQAGDARPPVRVALGTADGPRAAALLALDLLGIAATPVPGLTEQQAEEALAQGAVDATLIFGGTAQARMAALQARPWLRLDPAGAPGRGEGPRPHAADPPGLSELLGVASPAMAAALRAVSAALTVPAMVVLPALTQADMVALWRDAARRWLAEEARTAPPGLRLTCGPDTAPLLAALATPPTEAALAYRDWLQRRLHWQAE